MLLWVRLVRKFLTEFKPRAFIYFSWGELSWYLYFDVMMVPSRVTTTGVERLTSSARRLARDDEDEPEDESEDHARTGVLNDSDFRQGAFLQANDFWLSGMLLRNRWFTIIAGYSFIATSFEISRISRLSRSLPAPDVAPAVILPFHSKRLHYSDSISSFVWLHFS